MPVSDTVQPKPKDLPGRLRGIRDLAFGMLVIAVEALSSEVVQAQA